jgi:D-aminoacyl-tRNA deacylase
MKDALLEMAKLKEEMELNYEVSYECTHHGPSLDVPTMFAELGSSLKQWKDVKAAEVVAHAAMTAVSKRSSYPTMIPKYAIPQVDAEIIKQCVERTMENVDSAILDWKGIKGADKNKIVTALGEIGVPIEKV